MFSIVSSNFKLFLYIDKIFKYLHRSLKLITVMMPSIYIVLTCQTKILLGTASNSTWLLKLIQLQLLAPYISQMNLLKHICHFVYNCHMHKSPYILFCTYCGSHARCILSPLCCNQFFYKYYSTYALQVSRAHSSISALLHFSFNVHLVTEES